jgi:hypothetical protein
MIKPFEQMLHPDSRYANVGAPDDRGGFRPMTMANRSNIFLGAAATSALLESEIPPDYELLAPITVQELLSRRAIVAVEMALLLGLRGAPDKVQGAAQALAAHPRRSALMTPLIVSSAERTDGVREIVAGLAAPGQAEAVVAACYEQNSLPRDAVRTGDPRIVDYVLHRLAFLFELEPS